MLAYETLLIPHIHLNFEIVNVKQMQMLYQNVAIFQGNNNNKNRLFVFLFSRFDTKIFFNNEFKSHIHN